VWAFGGQRYGRKRSIEVLKRLIGGRSSVGGAVARVATGEIDRGAQCISSLSLSADSEGKDQNQCAQPTGQQRRLLILDPYFD